MGLQTKYKHFNKTLLFRMCKSHSRFDDKDCIKDVTFIKSIPVLHVENSVPTLFSPVASDMTSNLDVREVDLDTQISFLKAVPFSLVQTLTREQPSLGCI